MLFGDRTENFSIRMLYLYAYGLEVFWPNTWMYEVPNLNFSQKCSLGHLKSRSGNAKEKQPFEIRQFIPNHSERIFCFVFFCIIFRPKM